MRAKRPSMAVALTLAALVVATGCVGNPNGPTAGGRGTPRPGPKASPAGPDASAEARLRTVPQRGPLATISLAGRIRLLSNNGGGIISNNAGAIISDNGGGIISDNGGGLISDGGGGLVGNNAGSLRLLQAPGGAREALLADAEVTVHDAEGRQLVDEAGEPLRAVSDRTGGYRLDAALPAENLVLRIRLWQGGMLAAIATRDRAPAAPVDLDTASSIGATYVLRQFVKGRQPTFDKLPGSEAARLKRDLDGARGLLTRAPAYAEAELEALGDDLRRRVPAVDRTLADIEALLIGQANLGAGRQATDVPLLGPQAIAAAPDGTLYVGEPVFGRLRAIAKDGTISTFADVNRGRVKRSFPTVDDLATGPDGSLYVLQREDARVHRIWPDGRVEHVAGNGRGALGALGGLATQTTLPAAAIAVGPDGTLYLGTTGEPRVIAVGPDGRTRLAATGRLAGGNVASVVATADALYYLEVRGPDATYRDRVARVAADGTETEVSTTGAAKDLAVGPDGTVYEAEAWSDRVVAFTPGQPMRVVPGPAGQGLNFPHVLAMGADGVLHVVSRGTSLVHALRPDGTWAVEAGKASFEITEGALTDIPLNGPTAVAFDAQGRMIVAEDGTGTLKRFDGERFTPVGGGVPWTTAVAQPPGGGEDVPALEASLASPRGLAMRGEELLVVDASNQRLRALSAAGRVRTLIGQPGPAVYQDATYPADHAFHPRPEIRRTLRPGDALPSADFFFKGTAVAAGPGGDVYVSTLLQHQVVRLGADGRVRLVAGLARTDATPGGLEDALALAPLAPGTPAAERPLAVTSGLAFGPDGALYVAEMGGLRIVKVTDPAGPAPTLDPVVGIALDRLLALPETARPEGEGLPALDAFIGGPMGLCFDREGNLYYSELGTTSGAAFTTVFQEGVPLPEGARPTYPRVRKLGKDGRVTTVAGPGGRWFPDPAAEDALVLPVSIAIDPRGRLVIVDTGANLVRILPAGTF